jgi:hypothetical protein
MLADVPASRAVPASSRSPPVRLTCDGYGKVRDDGTPADPASSDYRSDAG